MRDQPLPPEVLASRPRTDAEREYLDTLERVGDTDTGGVMAGAPLHPLRPLSPEDYAGVSVPTLEQLREARERGRAEFAALTHKRAGAMRALAMTDHETPETTP